MSSSGTTPAAAAASAPAPAAAAATSKASAPAAASGGASASTSGAAATSTKAATASKKKKASGTKAATTTTTKKKPARKRKPPVSKANASASNQAVWSEARAASSDLAQQRALGAARRADPLWYRIEDVIPVNQKVTPLSSPMNAFLSEQMQVVESALEKNGLTRSDLTPQALACLSEHARRYTQELLRDAQDFADTVGRPEISRADLLLASEMRHDHPVAISTQLPQLNLIARQVNRKPLPPVPSHCYSGIVLPPKQNQLTARTFDIVSGALTAQKMSQTLPEPPGSTTTPTSTAAAAATAAATAGSSASTTAAGGNSKRKSSSSSYGASRGRQIPVKLKDTPSTSTTTASSTGGGGAAGAS